MMQELLQQKVSLFQNLQSTPSKAVGLAHDEEVYVNWEVAPFVITDEEITLMNAGMICQFLNGGVVGRGLSTRKVGIIMTSLGFRKVHTMQGNFFEVYQIPPDQIQATLAMTETREHEDSTPQEGVLPF